MSCIFMLGDIHANNIVGNRIVGLTFRMLIADTGMRRTNATGYRLSPV